MKGIPKDYENSAMIDGCGYAGAFIRIIVPLVKPGIITVVIFSFFAFWNEFPLAMTLISSDSKKTLPIGLANLMEVQRYATDWGALFAGLVIVLVPTIIVYMLTQDKLTKGMQLGGLKG
jgi:N-acetylglucosamine transport system permease protein